MSFVLQVDIQEMGKNEAGAIGKLRKYYSRLGFKLLKGTPSCCAMGSHPFPT